jgi:hypothetical protein
MHVVDVVIVASEVPPFIQAYDNMLNEVLIINRASEIMSSEVHMVIQADENMPRSPSRQNFPASVVTKVHVT